MPKSQSVTPPADSAADEMGDPFKLIALKDAAEKRSVTYWQMHQDVKHGRIPAVYQGRRVYVTERDLNAFIAGLPTTPN